MKTKSAIDFKYKWIRGAVGILILGYLTYKIFIKSPRLTNNNDLDLDPILPPSGSILKSIAVPRVSGSPGIAQVRSFIKSQFSPKHWDIEEDSHVIDSPHGASTTFTNLIFTFRNGGELLEDRIILAAHYDSKLLEAEGLNPEISIKSLESKFVGASDSAWSCALMIAIAKRLQGSKLTKNNFQLIFFDGEEAVLNWSKTDSLFGSRALAKKWSKLPFNEHFNSLKRIKLMVLLDLLGTRDANKIYSFHPETTQLDADFRELIRLEDELFPGEQDDRFKIFQESNQFKGYKGEAVEDDHTPFLPFGVPSFT